MRRVKDKTGTLGVDGDEHFKVSLKLIAGEDIITRVQANMAETSKSNQELTTAETCNFSI